MGRLLLFLSVAAALVAAAALVSWRVDPGSEFYDPAPLRLAAAERPPCLVSDELLSGENYLTFKEDVFRTRPTRRLVVGSSRVLKIGAWPGERTFANLGMPATTPASILRLFRDLPARPLTAYVGVEFFWFNPSWQGLSFRHSLSDRLRYLLSRRTLRLSWTIARDSPSLAWHGRRRLVRAGRCVIGRTSPAISWQVDGSRLYSFEFEAGGYRPPAAPFTRDVDALRHGLYANWRSFDRDRLAELDRALAVAQRKGWHVVGFAPPDATRYVRLFESSPELDPYWREFARLVPPLFRRHGFRWLDLRDVRAVPCAEADFVDDGFHTNARCAARIRARLDAA